MLSTAFNVIGQSYVYFPHVEYITSDDGLSQNEVTCIIQDKKGFLWMGTRGGLNRYDGQNFKIFQNEIDNINSLSNNSIEALFECSTGYIWIGTKSNGLSRYNPVNNQFHHFYSSTQDSNRIKGDRVISIAEGNRGEIWAGTWENGLTIFNYEKNTYHNLLLQRRIKKIIKSTDGNMWISTTTGLFVFNLDGQQLNFYPPPTGAVQFTDLIEDQNSGLFQLGTWNQGVWTFNPEKETFERIVGNLNELNFEVANNAYHLLQDDNGKIWIGSWGGGLSYYDPLTKLFSYYDLSSGDEDHGKELYRDILFIYKDRSEVLWLGTNGGGVCKIDERIEQFGLMNRGTGDSGLPKEPIYSIMKDGEGVLWVGEKGSEYIYYSLNGTEFNSLLIPRVSSNMRPESKLGARTLFQTKDGIIWLSTNYSLYKIEKGRGNYKVSQVLVKDNGSLIPSRLTHVSKVYQTSDGNFWIGQQQFGLKRSMNPGDPETQEFQSYTISEQKGGLKSNRISALIEDSSGRFWIGTYNGLHLFRPSSDDFLHYDKIQGSISSLSSDIVICLYEDSKGNLWVGTPNGLNIAIPGKDQSMTFKCYQEKDGLPNNYIHGILEDKNGNLWISTNKGISRFDPEEGIFYNFDVNDGLQSNSFMEGVAWKDDDGMFFFGGINGLNVFHPDSIERIINSPAVVLTGFKIFDKDVLPGQKIGDRVIIDKSIEYCDEVTLTYNENVFSIEYSALNFQTPGSNSYMYRMGGLEENWNSANNQTSITYSNLKPGDYTFQVKASNNNDVWREKETRLLITILPPFWATWQAFVLYALIFIGLLLLYRHFIQQQNKLLNKLNLSQLERKKDMEMAEMKTQFFTNITHELRTPLTLITGPVEAMMEVGNLDHEQKDHLTTVRHHTKRLLNLVTQLLDFRKAETGNMKIQVAQGNIVKYAHEIFLSFKELAEEKHILYQFNVSHKEIQMVYDRDNMEIVLCNLLSNAFKHTNENGTITLSLRKVTGTEESKTFPEGYCEIIVEDTGDGMSQDLVEKIFDRFYQISNTNSVKLVGTGIGLALVKNIVDLHSGKVFAKSEVGKGSKFVLRIPQGKAHYTSEQIIEGFRNSEHISHYQVEESISHSIPSLANVSLSKDVDFSQTILVVEDNPEIRAFVKKTFWKSYNVLEAENGQLGLKLANKHIPDAIISDVMMPEMDGLAFCKHIKAEEKTAHIPFVMLTARTTNVYKVEGYHSGADAYVTKPFQPSVLLAQVESLIISRVQMKERFSKMITLQPTDIEISSLDEAFLKQAIKLVEENISNDDLNRDFMAKSLAISASSLYRRLKALSGMTTNAFVRSIRLKRAAQMMKSTQFNISEIAYQVGFSDLKYFRICFKSQFGVNPSDYIQQKSPKFMDTEY